MEMINGEWKRRVAVYKFEQKSDAPSRALGPWVAVHWHGDGRFVDSDKVS